VIGIFIPTFSGCLSETIDLAHFLVLAFILD